DLKFRLILLLIRYEVAIDCRLVDAAKNRHCWRSFSVRPNYPLQIATPQSKIENSFGVLAQLVERLNGIEEVRGSNPLGSRPSLGGQRPAKAARALDSFENTLDKSERL